MKHLVFTLTMPNRGSWNGRWSGEKFNYVRGRTYSNAEFRQLPKNLVGSHYYRWNDGWTACVKVEVVDSREKLRRLRKSDGFCGYDWMIDSLCLTGEIK